jgi:hypothetical protein
VNQISPGQQPVKQENASPGWRQASDLNECPHVDNARLLRDNARRFWSSPPHQLLLAVAAPLVVVAVALAMPTTAFFGDHMLGQGLVLPSGLLDWPFRASGTLLRHRPLIALSARVSSTGVNGTSRFSWTSTRK